MNRASSINALIIDDEKLSRDLIRHYLDSHPGISVAGECCNGLEGLNRITELRPELLFLDVQMPELNGFELLQELQPEHTPAVIFTTAFDQFAIKAFEVNAMGYLLKPFERSRFDNTVENVLSLIGSKKSNGPDEKLSRLLDDYHAWKSASSKPVFPSRLLVKESRKAYFLKIADVLYFEAYGDYVRAHTPAKAHLLPDSLQRLEQSLDPQQFIRIHRSTMVNVDAIREMRPHFNGEYLVVLVNGVQVKLSRTYKDRLKHFSGLE